jgi:hypothetical protein
MPIVWYSEEEGFRRELDRFLWNILLHICHQRCSGIFPSLSMGYGKGSLQSLHPLLSSSENVPGRAVTWPSSFPRHGRAREGENEKGKSDGIQLVVAPVLRASGMVEHKGKMVPSSVSQKDNIEAQRDRCTKLPPSIAPHDCHFSHVRELSSAA